MKSYIVYAKGMFDDYIKDGKVFIVKAKNLKAAKLYFAEKYYKNDEFFLEDVYGRTINMSFAEKFFFQTQDEADFFSESGGTQVSEEEFKKRVIKYFHPHIKWAQLYIDYFLSEIEGEKSFPDEMLKFIWNKLYLMSDEFTFIDIDKIPILD